MRHTYLLLMLLLFVATASFAQESTLTQPRKNMIEFQPLSAFIVTLGLGYQRAVSNKLTLEARLFSSISPGGILFHTELQANYFPLERHTAPRGFYVGPCLGVGTNISVRPAFQGAYLGGMTGYQWVFTSRLTINLGAGLMTTLYGKHVLFSNPAFIPICKLAIGYNF